MDRSRLLLPALVAVVGAAALAGLVAYLGSRPLSADTGEQIVMLMDRASRGAGQRRLRELGGGAPTDAAVSACWSRVQGEMLRQGASPQGADGVVGAARAEVDAANPPTTMFALPVVVREGRIGSEKVWLFRVQWAMKDEPSARRLSGLGHFYVLAIGAAPPHRRLGGISCS